MSLFFNLHFKEKEFYKKLLVVIKLKQTLFLEKAIEQVHLIK